MLKKFEEKHPVEIFIEENERLRHELEECINGLSGSLEETKNLIGECAAYLEMLNEEVADWKEPPVEPEATLSEVAYYNSILQSIESSNKTLEILRSAEKTGFETLGELREQAEILKQIGNAEKERMN